MAASISMRPASRGCESAEAISSRRTARVMASSELSLGRETGQTDLPFLGALKMPGVSGGFIWIYVFFFFMVLRSFLALLQAFRRLCLLMPYRVVL